MLCAEEMLIWGRDSVVCVVTRLQADPKKDRRLTLLQNHPDHFGTQLTFCSAKSISGDVDIFRTPISVLELSFF
jgi:hypothetical protein